MNTVTASELAIITDLTEAGEGERLAEFVCAVARRLSDYRTPSGKILPDDLQRAVWDGAIRDERRAFAAKAWQEGWEAGCNDLQYGDEDASPWTPNPYLPQQIPSTSGPKS